MQGSGNERFWQIKAKFFNISNSKSWTGLRWSELRSRKADRTWLGWLENQPGKEQTRWLNGKI